jgi:hypothetical protein
MDGSKEITQGSRAVASVCANFVHTAEGRKEIKRITEKTDISK